MKPLDLTGQKFYALTVKQRIGSRWGHSLWLCECECGTLCERTAAQLKLNTHVSCGCKTKEAQSASGRTHGETGTRLYRIWKNMKSRCNNDSVPCFRYYGGKGIRVCPEWQYSFQNFREWSINHGYADNLTIDRIDGNGNYCPENCRWVTMTVQNQNKTGRKHCEEL